jgi:magnesium chelatase subunit D
VNYPFTAIVGQERLKTALCLIAIHPGIGGVLIRGEKGTAKSTAARALADLLPPTDVVTGCPFNCELENPWPECPHCASAARSTTKVPVPFVDLPLGATEDRVLGTLDLEKALGQGKRAFQPGLLANANRGILYIDEVNLLADHLVDVLLDAAASGINTVQREGMAVIHPARFLLIGTMNPEEGKLRPQLLDRFGLVVDVTGAREADTRVEVVRRRLAFETDAHVFLETWAKEQITLRQRIVAAQRLLSQVTVEQALVLLISQICCEHQVDGLRADIVTHKTAQALAAFEGRTAVTADDVRIAAELALPHRRRSRQAASSKQPSAVDRQPAGDHSPLKKSNSKEQEVFDPIAPEAKPHLPRNGDKPQMVAAGRRQPTMAKGQGRFVRAVADKAPASLALAATLRAAAQRGSFDHGKLVVESADLHRKEFERRSGTYLLFVVDSSGSMGARRRMELVKGTVLELLQDAYEKRDQVGVIAFRGIEARVLLPFTADVDEAERASRELPTGGRTPLAHALVLARELVQRVQRSQPEAAVLLTLLSDGKANVSLPGTDDDPWSQALHEAKGIAEMKVPSLVLDTEAGFVQTGRARQLAQVLTAEYQVLAARSATEELPR